jgi:hypothetical protein
MNNLLLNQVLLSEGLFDMLTTLKRLLSNFSTNVTKKGLTINAEEYEIDGILQVIQDKAKEKGFNQVKADLDNKFEFVSGTEIFKVLKPKKDKHSWKLELVFNT